MDPQKLSQLDPKLREAYQRVMGTPIPSPQTAPVQAQTPPPPVGGPTPPIPDPTPAPQPQPQPEPEPTPIPTSTIEEPPTAPAEPPVQPPMPEPQPAIPAQPEPIPTPEPAISSEPPVQTSNFVQMNSEVAAAPSSPNFSAPIAQTQTVALKKKNHLMPILMGIVIVIFLAIYALFWTKIFNFKLPFLP